METWPKCCEIINPDRPLLQDCLTDRAGSVDRTLLTPCYTNPVWRSAKYRGTEPKNVTIHAPD
jgi:hypothetical protein